MEYAIGALQGDSIESWEKWGFGALRKQKWVFNNAKKYYDTHKQDIDNYLGKENGEADEPQPTNSFSIGNEELIELIKDTNNKVNIILMRLNSMEDAFYGKQ